MVVMLQSLLLTLLVVVTGFTQAVNASSSILSVQTILRSGSNGESRNSRSLKWNNNWYKTEEEKKQIQEEYEQQLQQEQEEYEQQLQQEQEEYEQYVEERKKMAEEGQSDATNQEFYGYGYDDTGYGYSDVESGLDYEAFGDSTTTVVSQSQGAASRSQEQKWTIASGVLMAVGSLVAVGMYIYARRKAMVSPPPVEKNFNLMEEPTVEIA
jgi:hypothetical protein